jgi:tRNA pseudouridine32 synthase/23S rRNA pseudouridine746 synthase
VTYFDPQPAPDEVPVRLASPFAPGAPPALARRAAEALQLRLRRGDLPGGVDLGALDAPGGGKMFGVLVVSAPDGRVGYLCGFSGMLGDRWYVEGFVPPLFDPVVRDAFWPAGEADLRALADRHAELVGGAESVALRASLAELTARHRVAADELRAHHDANRRLRHDARRHLTDGAAGDDERRAALARESRADAAERGRLDEAHHQEREALESALRALDARRAELEHQRAGRSRQLWQRMADSYVLLNARGEARTLGALFANEAPPGGAGDCAAPKLLGHAYRHGLEPLALAEFWWGAPPLSGGRDAGAYYPACQHKCGRVLPYMLEGLSVEPPLPGAVPLAVEELRLVYEDRWLLVVDKPQGLLSVPGRHDPRRDSVLVRLQRRFADAAGLQVVHLLEPEASGLLLVARDPDTYAALQRQFARSEAEERQVAWLDGHVAGDHGVVELPLRGKRALTEWRVMQRTHARTRVALWPRTARPHQPRVHAAHPQGLGVPIVGDRLHGRDATRLMLHVEALAFLHPHTGARVAFESPAPF